MARKVKVKIEVPTEEELADIMYQLGQADAEQKKLEAELTIKVNTLKQRYAAKIASRKAFQDSMLAKLEAWADSNPDRFQKKRSITLLHGVIGYRKTPPKVSLKRGLKDTIGTTLKSVGLDRFVRTELTIDKDAILAEADDVDVITTLAPLGVKITTSETFFAKPKDQSAND